MDGRIQERVRETIKQRVRPISFSRNDLSKRPLETTSLSLDDPFLCLSLTPSLFLSKQRNLCLELPRSLETSSRCREHLPLSVSLPVVTDLSYFWHINVISLHVLMPFHTQCPLHRAVLYMGDGPQSGRVGTVSDVSQGPAKSASRAVC